ncbi:hypothetical protein PV04_07216 [Phialophora macrospora]|uniref:Uncharacterized protein n=1 Tax=Phialophora macrospora TaxID=1851006 RepID=A0A0D2DRV6_9EURO|nr:hypothetical protein PV04_07216 [Phialophora macrospora]
MNVDADAELAAAGVNVNMNARHTSGTGFAAARLVRSEIGLVVNTTTKPIILETCLVKDTYPPRGVLNSTAAAADYSVVSRSNHPSPGNGRDRECECECAPCQTAVTESIFPDEDEHEDDDEDEDEDEGEELYAGPRSETMPYVPSTDRPALTPPCRIGTYVWLYAIYHRAVD